MKTAQTLVAAAGMLAVANASLYANATVWETITTSVLTTYCPEPTTLVHGTKTYTVTEATTLTITDCPCTFSKPVHSVITPTTAPGLSTMETVTTPIKTLSPPVVVPPPKNVTEAPVWTTTTVSSFVTVCPEPTTFTWGPATYTVSEATTLTITKCPGGCTISYTQPPVATPTPSTTYVTQTHTSAGVTTEVVTTSVVTPEPSKPAETPKPSVTVITLTNAPGSSAPVVTTSTWVPEEPLITLTPPACHDCPKPTESKPAESKPVETFPPASVTPSAGPSSALPSAPPMFTGAADKVAAGLGSVFVGGLAALLL